MGKSPCKVTVGSGDFLATPAVATRNRSGAGSSVLPVTLPCSPWSWSGSCDYQHGLGHLYRSMPHRRCKQSLGGTVVTIKGV